MVTLYIVLSLFTLSSSFVETFGSEGEQTPRCRLPLVSRQVTSMGGSLTCSGHADPYWNIPTTYEDLQIQVAAKGFVNENFKWVMKEDLAVPIGDPESSECHLICPPGFIPSPESTTSCSAGVWSHDPATMQCTPSPCGVPTAPQHGKFSCYGNPSTCYLTCDPGYATMSNTKLTCQNGSWNANPASIECEVAVALMIGGEGHINWQSYSDHPEQYSLEQCQTTEVFSPIDETCSAQILPPMEIGVIYHTSHLLNGEILQCGGSGCGRVKEGPVLRWKLCFKMLENNTWALHSQLPNGQTHDDEYGAIQQGNLQLLGNIGPNMEFNGNNWILGRNKALPKALYGGDRCLVVTSPTTFVVIGGSQNLLTYKVDSTVLEFNSLTGEWSELPEIPEGRYNHACALVTTRSGPGIMVAGGKNDDISEHALQSVYLLDLGTKMWHPAGNLTYGRKDKTNLVVLGEKVMVLGSFYFNRNAYTPEEETVEEYIVPCPSLRECSPSQQGTWTPTQRIINRRSSGSVLPVPASRFSCVR